MFARAATVTLFPFARGTYEGSHFKGTSPFSASPDVVAAFSKLIKSKSTFEVTSLTPLNGEESMLKTFGILRANMTSPVTATETFSFGSILTTELDGLNIVAKTAIMTRITKMINRIFLSFICHFLIFREELVQHPLGVIFHDVVIALTDT